uniref:Alpha-mannosidase n=1 Tax=Timema tahoe TaxID=61484 RepID=A0A7R9IAQ9_9NEOP|nr:unnamed protein product [Timema tahoe]
MRVRRLSAILGASLILGGCFMLYLIMDLTFLPQEIHSESHNKWAQLEDRLNQLEDDLRRHHDTVGQLKHSIKDMVGESLRQESLSPNRTTSSPRMDLLSCGLQVSTPPHTDVQLLELYKQLKFDNLDGGAWKQGWNIEYSQHSWNPHKKLKVFVVPHSHNDPGWIKTYEDYYHSQTRNILNNMIKKLREDDRRKFIWAETSYLALWWDEISQEEKAQAKQLLANGQLEVVMGGWVMNDEANTDYYSILTQMIEGHQWLQNNMDYTPRSSWSIDPFGESPSMAFLVKRMGLENLVIQRVHYSVKKMLARSKNLEFLWRQTWDGSGSTDLLTHMMPFYSYDVPHTCGPDPKVCCQFDFRRLPGYGMACPWRTPPQVITEHNVAHRAEMLLDQYRKKAQLYRTNVVLAPLGDDFRYDQASEWDAQFNNYQRIFDYLNTNPTLNVEAQFGTLSDFFTAVREEVSPEQFPTLSGDFFTYADRDDHYWSGYYTSRPFYKRLDRVLMGYLRSAEIVFGLAWSSRPSFASWLLAPETGLTKLLSDARRSLSLFQHHDGVTGTARDYVVEDYAKKLHDAIRGSQHIIQQSVYALLTRNKDLPDSEFTYFDLDDVRKHHYSIPEKTVLAFGPDMEAHTVVLFNSLTWQRKELVTVRVSTAYVKVTNSDGDLVPSQTSPVFLRSGSVADSHYDIMFIGEVPPLGLATYRIHAVHPGDMGSSTFASLKMLNMLGDIPKIEGFQNIEVIPDGKEFSISSDQISAVFTAQGLLKAVTLKSSGTTFPLHVDLARYSARPGKERSGAYLFLPDGQAVMLTLDRPLVMVVEGPLLAQVRVLLPEVQHYITLYNTPGVDSLGLEVNNIVDITDHNNYEFIMRISTNIQNNEDFFTDLNNMQMIRRKHFTKLPLQANYYPLPGAVFIEDDETRLTILTAQPLGVAALKPGQVEIMQDRRLNQDDGRGLGQGVLDNRPTPTSFRLILESKTSKCQGTARDHPSGFLTAGALVSSQSLLHPLTRLLLLDQAHDGLEPGYSMVQGTPGIDVHLVKLHSFPSQSEQAAGALFYRQHLDPCYPVPGLRTSTGLLNVSTLFPIHFGPEMRESSLSFLHYGRTLDKSAFQPLCPMEMTAFVFPR